MTSRVCCQHLACDTGLTKMASHVFYLHFAGEATCALQNCQPAFLALVSVCLQIRQHLGAGASSKPEPASTANQPAAGLPLAEATWLLLEFMHALEAGISAASTSSAVRPLPDSAAVQFFNANRKVRCPRPPFQLVGACSCLGVLPALMCRPPCLKAIPCCKGLACPPRTTASNLRHRAGGKNEG